MCIYNALGEGMTHDDYNAAREFKNAPRERDDTYTPDEVKRQLSGQFTVYIKILRSRFTDQYKI